MNRIDRLLAILLSLQDKPQTSEQLARRFEISRRTVLRDMQALSEMGVPVIAREGPGGGYALMEDYRIEPLPLTGNEAFLLLLALYGIEQLSDLPFRQELNSLTAKVRALLPQAEIARAQGLLANVEIGGSEAENRAPFLAALLQATEGEQWVRVTYRSSAQLSVQHVLPQRVYTQEGYWYCRAYSAERGEERTYRADRILDLRPPADDFVPPALAARIPYDHPSHPQVIARLSPRGVAMVESNRDLRRHVRHDSEQGGELIFRCPPHELNWFAHYFAGLGAEVEVMEPPELRERLQQLGHELAERYAKR
jgi:predicted DNA-binding transcriptional regulator YafY